MEAELQALTEEVNLRRQADANLNERLLEQAAQIQDLTQRLERQRPDDAEAFAGAVARAVREGNDGPGRLKPPRPVPYSGDTRADVEEWLFRVEQYFLATSTPESNRVSYAAALLNGSAASWWRQKYQENAQAEVCTIWIEFKQALTKQFKFIATSMRAREDLHTTSLRSFRDMTDFCRYFRGKVLQVDGMTDEEQVFLFCRKLEPQMRSEILSKQPKTLNECVLAAETIAAVQNWRNPFAPRGNTFKKKGKPQGYRNQTFYQGTGVNGKFGGGSSSSGPTPMEVDTVQYQGRGGWRGRGRYGGRGGGRGRNAGRQYTTQNAMDNTLFNPRIKCFTCRKVGHPMSKCPMKSGTVQMAATLMSEPQPEAAQGNAGAMNQMTQEFALPTNPAAMPIRAQGAEVTRRGGKVTLHLRAPAKAKEPIQEKLMAKEPVKKPVTNEGPSLALYDPFVEKTEEERRMDAILDEIADQDFLDEELIEQILSHEPKTVKEKPFEAEESLSQVFPRGFDYVPSTDGEDEIEMEDLDTEKARKVEKRAAKKRRTKQKN